MVTTDQVESNGNIPVLGTTPPVDTQNSPNTGDLQAPAAPAPVALSPNGSPAASPQHPSAAPQPGTDAGAAQHQGILGEIFQTLAGGKKKVWQQTDKGPVATYEDLKPGEMARGILAAAITGLAGGYDPKNRGRGPAMSSAFTGGFKENQEATDKKAEQAKEEAQKQFSNQNLSDEMVLRKQKAAQEQQESITRMQRDFAETERMKQDAAQGKILFQQGQDDRTRKLGDEWAQKESWTKVIDPKTNKPFSFTTWKEANDAGNEHAGHLSKPGDYHTGAVQNPNDGLWYVLEQPKGYKEIERVRFAEMEKDGVTPKKDEHGKWIPDGTRGADGKVMPPTSMTGEVYDGWQKEQGGLKKQTADTAASWGLEKERLAKVRKENEQSDLSNRILSAGGNLWAVDIHNGTAIMSNKDRGQLAAQAKLQGQAARDAMNTFAKAMSDATNDETRNALSTRWKEAADSAQEAENQFQSLGGKVNRSDALSNSIIRNFTDNKNGFDDTKALASFDEDVRKGNFKIGGYTPEDLAKAREAIQAEAQKHEAAKSAPKTAAPPAPGRAAAPGTKLTPMPQAIFDAGNGELALSDGTKLGAVGKKGDVIVNEINAIQSPIGRAEYIDKLNVPDEAKAKLKQLSAGTEESATVLMLAPDGSTRKVPQADVNKWLGQGLTIRPQ